MISILQTPLKTFVEVTNMARTLRDILLLQKDLTEPVVNTYTVLNNLIEGCHVYRGIQKKIIGYFLKIENPVL